MPFRCISSWLVVCEPHPQVVHIMLSFEVYSILEEVVSMIYFSIRIARMRNSVPWSISRSWLPQAGQESNQVSGTNLLPHFRHRACGMSAAMSISASGEAVCDSRVRIQKHSELQSMPANLPTSSSMVVIRFPPRRSRSLSTISKMLYAKELSLIHI